jgi:hypothetical protein
MSVTRPFEAWATVAPMISVDSEGCGHARAFGNVRGVFTQPASHELFCVFFSALHMKRGLGDGS